MTLLDKAVRWLEPAQLVPRWQTNAVPSDTEPVPAWIRHQFLAGSRSPGPLPADSAEYEVVAASLAEWEPGRPGALAFLGPFGAGKTTVLRRIETTFSQLPLTHHRFASRILGQAQLLQQLADVLGLPSAEDVDDLAARLQAGPRRVILLDDCHLLFLRRPRGFEPLDLLLRLIRTTSRHILWITGWNIDSWIYLEHLRSPSDHFTLVHTISPQSLDEMRRMLLAGLNETNLKAGWPAEEDEAIFRTIWTRARGRPALALHIFLRSLCPAGDGEFALRADTIYRLPQQCPVKDSEEAYALGDLIRHSVLTVRELASISHISEAHAATILARTTAKGLTVSLEPDYRLNPIYVDAVVAYLDSRRAISFREVTAA